MALYGAGPCHGFMCTLQVDGMQLINALQKEEYQDVPIIGEHKGSTGHSAHK